jgi:two-component system, OmpR family, KDP operon response regulator KdpE
MKPSRILIVDDDPAIRKFVRVNLEARDYEVLLATDGNECINLIEKEPADLILLDIMMPNIDGFEVCRRIRNKSRVPIIIFSAREGETDKEKCFDCGANGYLTKPFVLKEILLMIKQMLDKPAI